MRDRHNFNVKEEKITEEKITKEVEFFFIGLIMRTTDILS